MYRLIFQTGQHAGRSLAVRQSVLVVGRAPSCHLSLPGEAGLAPRHLRLEENAAGVFVCALDPAFALRVDGETVTGDRRLREGDILEIGATRIRFSEGRGEVGFREERRRLAMKGKVSHGVIQPLAGLLALGLVGGEILLLAFLMIWSRILIKPSTERADLERAEAIRLEEGITNVISEKEAQAAIEAADWRLQKLKAKEEAQRKKEEARIKKERREAARARLLLQGTNAVGNGEGSALDDGEGEDEDEYGEYATADFVPEDTETPPPDDATAPEGTEVASAPPETPQEGEPAQPEGDGQTAAATATPAEPQPAPVESNRTSIVTMPGEMSPAVAAERAAAEAAVAALEANPNADLSEETNATVVAMAMLQNANFEPATTETSLADLPPLSAADPRIADAQRLLAQADAAAQFADYGKALKLLAEIHATAPGFLPAYEVHAKVLELQGKPADALVRWRQLKGLAPEDSPYLAKALDGISRVESVLALAEESHADLEGAPLGSRARLLPPDVQKLPDTASGDIAEMRVLRTGVEILPRSGLHPGDKLLVHIEFFDRTANDKIVPSHALVPGSPVEVTVPGGSGNAVAPIDNYTYVIPRGMLGRSHERTAAYYGYRIRVFAGPHLLDAIAKPKKLMDMPEPVPAQADPENLIPYL